jgi:YidC/Oxa1 family membrane protein insertase
MTTAEAAKARAEAEAAVETAREAAEVAAFESLGAQMAAVTPVVVAALDPATVNRRCKRRRLSSLVQDGSNGVQVVLAAANTSA